jgi:hypothetical protein
VEREEKTPDAMNPPNGGAVKALVPIAPAIPDFDRSDPVALYLNAGLFGQLQRVAKLMSTSSLVPEHFRSMPAVGNREAVDRTADCFLVAAQAVRWGIDIFAAAQCCHVVKGRLGYEGKLIAAVINSRPEIERRLNYKYVGEGKARRVRVFARLRGESEDRDIEGTVGEWATDNEKWRTIPDQMLSYRGAREWARRHLPEALLGVYSEDEVHEIVTLGPESVKAETTRPAPPDTPDPLVAKATAAPGTEKIEDIVARGGKLAIVQDCPHPNVPPSKLEALAPGKSLVCDACGEELKRDRDPGSEG